MSFLCITGIQAQEMQEEGPDNRPVKDMFKGIYIIDNPSVIVPIKGTFEFDIQHRFGVIEWEEPYENALGLSSPANMRLGFEYVPIERLMVGFGITKFNKTWDVHAKYALLRQTRSGSIPLSISYYVNAAIDTRDKSSFLNPDLVETADRVSYFHQIALGRKFSEKFSLQVAASLSHFNTVDAQKVDNIVVDKWKNDHLAVSASARYSISPVTNILFNYDQPITTHEVLDPKPNLSFGVEINTSSHSFQFFLGNYYNILPQYNNVFNNHDPFPEEDFFESSNFLIGFNLTRLWNF